MTVTKLKEIEDQGSTTTILIESMQLIYLLNKQMIIDNSCLDLANTQDERFTPFFGYQDQRE
jgi:hypothetical protein